MKEFRLSIAGGAWRVAFAFDPKRQAILLVAGDKSGVARDRFYRPLIKRAERRFADWIKEI
ncbi:MAG TPA: type II toxin-antitoxin system RelE/ParE family toxin [Caulobacteraceae bacterium]|nr:type II toxin-antitoxin system RelE/ParE family toxin [Caulobacteraceae bacterium]